MQPVGNNQNYTAAAYPQNIEGSSSYEQDRSFEQIPHEISHLITVEYWSALTYEQRAILNQLNQLPGSLKGIVPESVWETLPVDSKMAFIFEHNILPRTIASGEFSNNNAAILPPTQEILSGEVAGQVENNQIDGEVILDQQNDVGHDFEQAVQEVRKVEENFEKESQSDVKPEEQPTVLNAEEQARIDTETGKSFTTMSIPKTTGYPISTNVISKLDDNLNGGTSESDTWAAHLYNKLVQAFQ